jgi:hypothetical protein
VEFETGTVSSLLKAAEEEEEEEEEIIDMVEIYCDIVQNWTRIGLIDRIRLLGLSRQNGIWKVPELQGKNCDESHWTRICPCVFMILYRDGGTC